MPAIKLRGFKEPTLLDKASEQALKQPQRLPSGHHEPLTIDCTPTWRGILPLLLAGLENGTPAGRKIALEELQRMADLADAHVAFLKGPKPVGLEENIGSTTP